MDRIEQLDSALSQMRGLGLAVDALVDDGLVRRVDVEGQKRGKKAGWYVCHWMRLDDGSELLVGGYGIWQGAENNAQKLKVRGTPRLSEAERTRLKEQQKRQRDAEAKARAELASEAAKRSRDIWRGLSDSAASAYLSRKQVRGYGVRFARDGVVVVPLQNVAGLLVGLQFIQADGSKRFITGTQKLAAWHLIGTVSAEHPLVLAEGYATAASVHMATGWPVAVCFDCGNLLPVGQALKDLYPDTQLLIAGDDDHQRTENAGRVHAGAAAQKLGCKFVLPRFTEPEGRTDFNDLHVAEGLEAVGTQLRAILTPIAPADAEPDEDASWQRRLVCNKNGIQSMVYNAMLVLENHPAWRDVFAYDQFQKRLVKRKATPYGGQPGPMTDADEIEVAAWFGRPDTYGVSITTTTAREALIAHAMRRPFHPVREYLRSLKWDGIDRIPTFFPDFCGVNRNDAVTQKFALNFFISAVARVMRPGCKADLMLVLEGEQGARKSSLAMALCGEAYYADIGTTPADKDFFQIIQGRWIVEISEMAAFAKAETSHIKRAVSTQIDTFRPSYGRNVESYPRECVFFGTNNDGDWQRDATGGRRFMPLWVQDIQLDAIRHIRDLLWAEALVRFERGETWWELPAEAREEQEQRYMEDAWAEPVHRWLDGKAFKERYASGLPAPIETTTASEILSRCLDVEPKKQDRAMQKRVGELMRRFGWRREQKRVGATRVWRYVRPKEAS